jgi:hypothetical protein
VVGHDYVEVVQHDEAAAAETNNAEGVGPAADVHDAVRRRDDVHEYEDEVGEADVVRDAESAAVAVVVDAGAANAAAEVVVMDVVCVVRAMVGVVGADAARMYDLDNVHCDAHTPEQMEERQQEQTQTTAEVQELLDSHHLSEPVQSGQVTQD